jgi:hypothetical protein
MLPTFEQNGEWWFWGLDGVVGPYASQERADAKYAEYCAYVIDAPACHHA